MFDSVHSRAAVTLRGTSAIRSRSAGQRLVVGSALETAKPAAQSSRSSSTGAGDDAGPEPDIGADSVTGGAELADTTSAELTDMISAGSASGVYGNRGPVGAPGEKPGADDAGEADDGTGSDPGSGS